VRAGSAIRYDTADFVGGRRKRGCTLHVSQNNANRRSAIDARTTRHPGYRISTIKRKRIEDPFGWMKTVGGLRKTRHRGRGLRPDRCRLQSHSHPEAPGRNGMSLSGASNMRQNRNQYRPCSADRDPSLHCSPRNIAKIALRARFFQQPAKENLAGALVQLCAQATTQR
jgi:hypothetical protein